MPPPAPPLPEPFTIMGYDGYAVVMIITFISGTALFILSIVCFSNRKKIGKKLKLLFKNMCVRKS